MTKYTVNDIMFAMGIYPAANANEKYALFLEMINQHFPHTIGREYYCDVTKLKKPSPERRASFASFLEAIDLEAEKNRYSQSGVQWIHLFSEEYPDVLKQIYTPPVVLFYQGDIALLNKLTWLGVVGSRDFSDYGKKAVEALLPPLIDQSNREIGVVSGLAKGIDTEAHMVTIKNGGYTVGAIGTGLDRFYPPKNKMLQEYMADNQLVISEYPLGAKPLKFHFPERNRIIAGLSRGVLVVEAKKSSGSLITAYNAIDESRDVFAVPGSIFEPNREGNNRLIQLGAILTQTSEDILKEWNYI